MRFKTAILYSALFFLAPEIIVAQSAAPQLDCKIINYLPQNEEAPEALEVSNGERINMKIGLRIPENNNLTAPNLINPSPIPTKEEYFLVKVIRESNNSEVPIQITDTGGGKNLNYLSEVIYIEIPYSKEARKAKAQATWSYVKAHSPEAAHWGSNEADLVNNIADELVENQLGNFKILCSYVSNKPGIWNGQISCPPIRINVVKRGTPVDFSIPPERGQSMVLTYF